MVVFGWFVVFRLRHSLILFQLWIFHSRKWLQVDWKMKRFNSSAFIRIISSEKEGISRFIKPILAEFIYSFVFSWCAFLLLQLKMVIFYIFWALHWYMMIFVHSLAKLYRKPIEWIRIEKKMNFNWTMYTNAVMIRTKKKKKIASMKIPLVNWTELNSIRFAGLSFHGHPCPNKLVIYTKEKEFLNENSQIRFLIIFIYEKHWIRIFVIRKFHFDSFSFDDPVEKLDWQQTQIWDENTMSAEPQQWARRPIYHHFIRRNVQKYHKLREKSCLLILLTKPKEMFKMHH